jgi:hypothetical protein
MSFSRRVSVWRAAVQIELWRHGWAWPMAVVLAVLAAVIYFLWVEPEHQALVRARLELAQESVAAPRTSAPMAVASEQQELQALQSVLQQSPSPDKLVRKMETLAQAEHIVLAQSDYQQQFHSATQVTQVRIMQPVRASYPQLRRYIEAVLRTIPNASLEQIAARRDNVGQSQLETRLRWSFWMQASSTVDLRKKSPAEGMQ